MDTTPLHHVFEESGTVNRMELERCSNSLLHQPRSTLLTAQGGRSMKEELGGYGSEAALNVRSRSVPFIFSLPQYSNRHITPLVMGWLAAHGLRKKWRSHPQTMCGEADLLTCLLCVVTLRELQDRCKSCELSDHLFRGDEEQQNACFKMDCETRNAYRLP